MRGITTETKKAQLLIQALPRKLYKLLWPALNLEGRDAEYTVIKLELLDMHGKTPTDRASKMFEYIGSTPSNMTPSMIWRTLQYLQKNKNT